MTYLLITSTGQQISELDHVLLAQHNTIGDMKVFTMNKFNHFDEHVYKMILHFYRWWFSTRLSSTSIHLWTSFTGNTKQTSNFAIASSKFTTSSIESKPITREKHFENWHFFRILRMPFTGLIGFSFTSSIDRYVKQLKLHTALIH